MLQLESFVKKYEHRLSASLSTPRLIDAWEIELPLGALIHHISDSQADIGIRGSHPLLQKEEGSARIAFSTEGYGKFGNYSKINSNTSSLIKAYRASQRGMQYFGTVDRAIARERELAVVDYSLLTRMFRYTNSVGRFYDEWRNLTTAIVAQVNDQTYLRNHIIPIKFPSNLPTEANFKKAEDELPRDLMDDFTESGHFWLRELRNLMLGKAEVLKLVEPKRVWFVITEGRNSVVLSAQQLIERGESQVTKIYDMFEKTLATRPGGDNDALADEDTSGPDITSEEQILPGTPNSLIRKVSSLAEAGKLTPSQARAMINVQQRTKQLPNPFDTSKSIEEASKITPEMTKVKERLVSSVNPLSVPSHALNASTNSLYADYVKSGLYEADILNMLQHFSAAGVMIQDIKKEDKIDALNDAMTLKVKLLPVNGKSTTLPIELFNVNEDGTFKADGVRYALDSQKVD
ncbi:RNA polymerase beta subunit [Vibrio phage vB_pir03]|nr:RNA polymerase beta subunit [Vibrio phage vB_pir03]